MEFLFFCFVLLYLFLCMSGFFVNMSWAEFVIMSYVISFYMSISLERLENFHCFIHNEY